MKCDVTGSVTEALHLGGGAIPGIDDTVECTNLDGGRWIEGRCTARLESPVTSLRLVNRAGHATWLSCGKYGTVPVGAQAMATGGIEEWRPARRIAAIVSPERSQTEAHATLLPPAVPPVAPLSRGLAHPCPLSRRLPFPSRHLLSAPYGVSRLLHHREMCAPVVR